MKRAIFFIFAVMVSAAPVGVFPLTLAKESANDMFHMAALPNDPNIAKQWYLEAVHLPTAWNFAKGSPTVTVAVIDSGVDLSHPDLKDRIWTNSGEIPGNNIDDDRDGYVDDVRGWDFIGNDNDPNPDLTGGSAEGIQHGTLVAGVIGAAGNNAVGITGVNWNVRIMPLRVLDSQGGGSTFGVDAAIRYAVRKGAKVINISFSGHGYSPVLANTLREAYKAGVIVVAAAGNEGDTQRGGNLNVNPEYPVCYKGVNNEPIVIGVAALDAKGRRSSFTNYGADCIGISAPGENFWLPQVYRPTVAGFEQAYGAGWSGSSLATPMVAGTAALLASMSPGISPADVRRHLMSHATDIGGQNPGFAADLGSGELDAGASILALQTALLSTGPMQAPGAAVPTSFVTGIPSAADLVAVTPGSGLARVSLLKTTLSDFTGFEAYMRNVSEPPAVTFADLEGDGVPSIVVGAPKGESPYVRVFNRDGALVSQFLAFAPAFRGGVTVARAEVDGDGKDEIAVAPESGGEPTVRMFKSDGTLRGEFTVGNPKARTGLHLAAIDTDLDGIDEIAIAPADAASRVIHVYGTDGKERFFFEPFGRVAWRGGFEIAAGDVNGDGASELVVAAGVGGPPKVTVFGRDGHAISSWTAYAASFRGGVAVSVGRVNGAVSIVTGPVSGGGQLRVFTVAGTLTRTSAPFGASFKAGLRPAADGLPNRRK